jgi:hypothetical protein
MIMKMKAIKQFHSDKHWKIQWMIPMKTGCKTDSDDALLENWRSGFGPM